MAKTNYQEANVLNGTLRTAAFVKPADVYIALFVSATDDTGGGTEVTGGGYARVAHGPLDTDWTDPGTGGSSANIGEITFPSPSGANWGTVTHFALFDAVTAGNMLYHGALQASRVINDGDGAPRFSDGTLVVTES